MNLQEERDFYKHLVEKDVAEQAIIKAATEQGASHPLQFVDFLGSSAKVVQEAGSDGETKLVAMIQAGDDLITPHEAVVRWKALSKNANLFQTVQSASPPPANGRIDVKTLSAEQYAEIRKTAEGRKKLGIA